MQRITSLPASAIPTPAAIPPAAAATPPATLLDLAEQINVSHQEAVRAASSAVEHAIETGRLLALAKSRVPHGEWLLWLKTNCKFKPRTAQKYIETARVRDELKCARNAHLGSKVLRDGIPEVVKAAEDGRMSVSAAAKLAGESKKVQRETMKEIEKGRKYSAKLGLDPIPGVDRGVGVTRANEAINSLKRIPKNDGLRKHGFQIVKDWIRQNERS
jgi:hypothetical protein